jgi:DNA replication and repair protein RecF
MPFSSIKLYGFRNLQNDEILLTGKDIFLIGENAQGKSNFLESVYFCSFASSFRNSKDSQLVQHGYDDCSVLAELSDSFNQNVLIKIVKGKKQIFIDGKREDRKKLLSVIPSIVFCHEDLSFINNVQEKRRWFFDQNLSIYDDIYLDDLRKYKKILKTRNLLLKEKYDLKKEKILEVIDIQLIEYGLRLIKRRNEEIKLFSELFQIYYEKIIGVNNIIINYKMSWLENDKDLILNKLKQKREIEFKLGFTLSGPHRDKYFFLKDASEFSETASTGQRRLLALLLRIVQAYRYSTMANNKPILLLDDVLLEIDGKKREKILSILPDYRQAFYTFLPEELYNNYRKKDTQVFFVKDGKLISETT